MAAAVLTLAACQDATIADLAPKTEKRLSDSTLKIMKIKGMTTTSPIMLRIFKEEGVLEVWKQKDNGRYDLVTHYEICKWSGKLGPKYTEGDRQAPEGFYSIKPWQMNPKSSYHLAFNIGYPNAFDRVHNRGGTNLMVHGACSSSGCYSMTDPQIEQIYAFARDAFKGGQQEFQVQAFPFRMTAENMARYKDDPNYPFWKNIKEGYDYFEITKVPPKVDVCEKKYVFNQVSDGGFSAAGSCPIASTPETLQSAYRSYQSKFDAAFDSALQGGGGSKAPAPTIAGIREAALVADWSRRRSRGEKVTPQPPSLQQPGATVAAAPSPRPEQPASAAAAIMATPSPAQNVANRASQAIAGANAATPEAAAPAAEANPQEKKRSRLWGLFGG